MTSKIAWVGYVILNIGQQFSMNISLALVREINKALGPKNQELQLGDCLMDIQVINIKKQFHENYRTMTICTAIREFIYPDTRCQHIPEKLRSRVDFQNFL